LIGANQREHRDHIGSRFVGSQLASLAVRHPPTDNHPQRSWNRKVGHIGSCAPFRGVTVGLNMGSKGKGRSMRNLALASASILLITTAPLVAQEQLFRSVDAVPGKQVRLALIGNVSPDCKVGPKPDVKVVSAPKQWLPILRAVFSRRRIIRLR
jgi:hypothetical protein